MGTNKRYADHYDGLMDARILERIAATSGPLQSLTDAELELDTEPLTIAPQPHQVKAWVRFGSTAIRVDAEACRMDRAGSRHPVHRRPARIQSLGVVIRSHPEAVTHGQRESWRPTRRPRARRPTRRPHLSATVENEATATVENEAT